MSIAEVKALESRSTTYRDYPEELKASVIAAIEANGGNVSATSKLFNISGDTVRYWWLNSERYREIQSPSAGNLADKLENIAHNTADSIAEHDLSVVALRDKAAVLAVVIDRMQLLRGAPTSIIESSDRVELSIVLRAAIESGFDLAGVIDVTPEPGGQVETSLSPTLEPESLSISDELGEPAVRTSGNNSQSLHKSDYQSRN